MSNEKGLTLKQQEWLIANNKTYPVKCKMCDHHTRWRASSTKGALFNTYCSPTCSRLDGEFQREKQTQTMVERYGGHSAKLQLTQYKKQQTNLERYGVEHPIQNKEVQEKQKQTNLERYGVEHPIQNKEVHEKQKQTNLERYWFENAFKNKEVQEKQKQTILERYGVTNVRKSKEIQEKIKQTILTKFGCHHTQLQIIQDKKIQTNLNKYGSKFASQKHIVDILPTINNSDWLIDQYLTQNKTAIQIANELGIDGTTVGRYLKKSEIQIRKYHQSYVSKLWLELIQKQENIIIEYEYQFDLDNKKLKADGFCKETNTIYEFHGDYWHGNPGTYLPTTKHPIIHKTMGELYQKTIEREQYIKSLGYNLIVIWESDFMYK